MIVCSFCGTTEHEADILIAKPPAFICDSCVSASVDIIIDHIRANVEVEQPHWLFADLVDEIIARPGYAEIKAA
jgi:ATP-dependent protease Clp ATPase subunit